MSDPRAAAIDGLRRRIDDLDAELVRLLNERARAALAIGTLKRELGLAVYQPEREQAVLGHVRAVNAGPLDDGALQRLFERIIDEARRLEREAGRNSNRGLQERVTAASQEGPGRSGPGRRP